MERIVYRKTLDVHKNGIQFTLQGFETADKMARRLELSLMASGDAIDLPLEQLVAVMYVTTPNATEPSINECIIKDNVIIYDVLPIVEEGITEMQLKLIDTRLKGANSVLMSPRFALEVTQSNADDSNAVQTTTYTALENAIANAQSVYAARLERIELDSDCMFRVIYFDGTVYESDVLKETVLKGEALLSQSYARGGTGLRAGEDTDNSKYYSLESKSASIEAKTHTEYSEELLKETRKHGVYTAFSIDFDTGEVKYISPSYKFNVNKLNGELEAIGQTYTPEATIDLLVREWLESKTKIADEAKTAAEKSLAIAKGKNQAHVFQTTEDLQSWLKNPENKGLYQVGDNLYIVDTDVPDWWISEVLTTPDSTTGYYYNIAKLETQKVDLTEINNGINQLNSKVDYSYCGDKNTPQVIGKTKEGKPIYRKVCKWQLGPGASVTSPLALTSLNWDIPFTEIYSLSTYIVSPSGAGIYLLPYYEGDEITAKVNNFNQSNVTIGYTQSWLNYILVIEVVYS